MICDTEIRALTAAELEQVSGGLEPIEVGIALGSGATLLGFGIGYALTHLPRGNLCEILNQVAPSGQFGGCPQ